MSIKKAQVVGFLLTSLLGTLLHFVFEWTGHRPPVGAISAVNESVWEHLKLIFFPMLVYGIAEYYLYGKRLSNFITVRFLSVLLGLLIVAAGYYTYTGILGYDVMPVNIILFELGLLAAYRFSYKNLKAGRYGSAGAKSWSLLGFAVLLILFVIFTYCPPRIDLFVDPQTGGYGIQK